MAAHVPMGEHVCILSPGHLFQHSQKIVVFWLIFSFWKGGKTTAVQELHSAGVSLQFPGLVSSLWFAFCFLTIILFAVLLHVDLQFAFRRLAVGVAIWKRKRDRSKSDVKMTWFPNFYFYNGHKQNNRLPKQAVCHNGDKMFFHFMTYSDRKAKDLRKMKLAPVNTGFFLQNEQTQ